MVVCIQEVVIMSKIMRVLHCCHVRLILSTHNNKTNEKPLQVPKAALGRVGVKDAMGIREGTVHRGDDGQVA